MFLSRSGSMPEGLTNLGGRPLGTPPPPGAVPLSSLGRLGTGPDCHRDIFVFILSILHILSRSARGSALARALDRDASDSSTPPLRGSARNDYAFAGVARIAPIVAA